MDTLPKYPARRKQSPSALAALGIEPPPESILSRSDLPLSLAGKLGWLAASRRVWPDGVLLNPAYALFLGRWAFRSSEITLCILPHLALAAAAITLREVLFAATPPGFGEEYAYWICVGAVQALCAPVMGLSMMTLAIRAKARALAPSVMAELRLCPNVKSADLVYGAGAPLAVTHSLGALVWWITVGITSHFYLLNAAAGGPLVGFSLLVLSALLLFAAFVCRVFCDQGIAMGLRCAFFISDPTKVFGRALRDFLLWSPINFLGVPVLFALLVSMIAAAGGLLLLVPMAIAFPVVMTSMAALTEQRAGTILRWTIANEEHWGDRRDGDSILVPEGVRQPWPTP